MIDGNAWRKSSRSGTATDCVEVHPRGAIRDSKNPGGPMLVFPGWSPVKRLIVAART